METQLSNIIQSDEFLGKLLGLLLGIPLPLPKNVLVHLELTVVSDVEAEIRKKEILVWI